MVDGKQYKSVNEAFTDLKLPLGKHISFRAKLKAAGKLDFEHDGKTYKFNITEAVKVPKPEKKVKPVTPETPADAQVPA